METFELIVVIIGAATLSTWIMRVVDRLEH